MLRGLPHNPSRTHQQHGLFMDESLLQGQRGGVQAWDYRSRVRGHRSQGARDEGNGNSLSCPRPPHSHLTPIMPLATSILACEEAQRTRGDPAFPNPETNPKAGTDLALALGASWGCLQCCYCYLHQAGLPLSCGRQWLLASPGPRSSRWLE